MEELVGWVDHLHRAGLFCSNCKFKIRYRDEGRFNYCPGCGKKITMPTVVTLKKNE